MSLMRSCQCLGGTNGLFNRGGFDVRFQGARGAEVYFAAQQVFQLLLQGDEFEQAGGF